MNKEPMHTPTIEYPYLPEGREILYVPADNPFILAAREFAEQNSLDTTMPTGSVIVRDGQIIGRGANGSTYHETHGCERVAQGIPTGQHYELCEGCHPKNHSEPKAVADANAHGEDVRGADLYLWGHWWCCEPCWNAMDGIRNVYLMEGSEVLFNKSAAGNIVGHQFTS